MRIHTLTLFLLLAISTFAHAQKATIKGKITTLRGIPIVSASISISNSVGTISSGKGEFSLEVPSGKLDLLISHSEFNVKTIPLELKVGEIKELTIRLSEKVIQIESVEINAEKDIRIREEAGSLELDAKTVLANVSAFGDFNQALTGQLGVVGNSELSSAYQVRGGNFDENLVYVNNIQVYRPFLVRSGQQEGLSFINPDLVENIKFSSGGWQAKYGDKLSSTLNIEYREPTRTRASLEAGLLGGRAHFEDVTKNGKFSYATGLRYKTSKYLLGTTETKGEYLPKFFDAQTFMTYDLSGKGEKDRTKLSFLGSFASNRYEVTPESRETTFGTFQQVLRLFVAFEGAENLNYDTWQGGLRLSHKVNENFTSNFLVSGMTTKERERINIEGGYRLCDIDKNTASSTFNECVVTRGVGTNFEYARNSLDATIVSAESRNEIKLGSNMNLEFGVRFDRQEIEDRLDEYAFIDSADFVEITETLFSENKIESNTISGYVQSTQIVSETATLNYGVRATYWDLNGQLLISPRIQYAFQPKNWERDAIVRFAAGLYQQPPFYRELRGFDGEINRDLKAQSSAHIIAGIDYDFKMWGRPFKLLSEVYYKRLWNVVPYDVDNVRVRYYANNDAEAKVTGFDVRLSGEFIKNAESWINISVLSAREDVAGDERDFIRRPSDQRVTFGMFFQDHFPNDPTWKVNLKLLYGTGLPYGPPNSFSNRQSLSAGTEYIRLDMGFSKLIIFNPKKKYSNSKKLETLWIGLDILNILGVDNPISFNWISDFSGNQYAVPNSLSQRFFNLRVVARY
ncbi:MAG: hypothetical protein ACJAWV_004119 [Flammeovirgaceae bacterium]|jgi:hypothetical protein